MFTTLSGTGKTVTIGPDLPTVVIGERINPTGKKSLAAALASGNLVLVREMAKAQVAAGADVLDVNVGIAGCDEVDLLRRAVLAVSEVADVPLSIDTANPKALEAALKVAPGRPLVNSVNGEEKSLGRVLPLVKEYKTAVIGLTLDERGVPRDVVTRLEIATKIVGRAEALGIPRQDILIDCLVLPVGTEQLSARIVLEAIEFVRERLGVNVNLGASNVSFGLPDRQVLTQSFVSIAIASGMNCVIADPACLCATVRAADLLMGRDEYAARFISYYRTTQQQLTLN